jgi:hypothetical protein
VSINPCGDSRVSKVQPIRGGTIGGRSDAPLPRDQPNRKHPEHSRVAIRALSAESQVSTGDCSQEHNQRRQQECRSAVKQAVNPDRFGNRRQMTMAYQREAVPGRQCVESVPSKTAADGEEEEKIDPRDGPKSDGDPLPSQAFGCGRLHSSLKLDDVFHRLQPGDIHLGERLGNVGQPLAVNVQQFDGRRLLATSLRVNARHREVPRDRPGVTRRNEGPVAQLGLELDRCFFNGNTATPPHFQMVRSADDAPIGTDRGADECPRIGHDPAQRDVLSITKKPKTMRLQQRTNAVIEFAIQLRKVRGLHHSVLVGLGSINSLFNVHR